ncbi:MAG TPA: ABC transporter substrate-binding protein [Acidimicrobiales bacterium]|nr:ABC transporter substrate-binding protein [Acidimicrobiales bacterium]
MKKQPWLRLLALLLTLALGAAACGGSSNDDDDATATTAAGGGGEEKPAGDPEPTTGFDGTTIKLGVLTPTSGAASIIGKPLAVGNQVYFDRLNAEGGVAGKYKVELDVRDTAYAEATAIQEYNATKGGVLMYTQIMGTAIIKAVLSQMKQDGIAGSPATLDADWIREPNLIPLGGPYQVQVINGLDWYMKKGGGEGKQVCSLAQDDPYGDAGQEGVDHAGEELGFEPGPRVDFAVATADFTTQINQLESAGCEAVVLVATPLDASGALNKAAQAGFAPTWLVVSPGFLKLLYAGDLAPYATEHVKVLSEGGNWGDESIPGMAQMLEDLATYGGDQVPDPYFAFGYSQARAVHQVLEKAVELGDLSHEGILKAITSIDELTFDGLLGDYKYGAIEDRDPPRASTIFKFDAAAPTGLTAQEANYESEAAKSFDFG